MIGPLKARQTADFQTRQIGAPVEDHQAELTNDAVQPPCQVFEVRTDLAPFAR